MSNTNNTTPSAPTYTDAPCCLIPEPPPIVSDDSADSAESSTSAQAAPRPLKSTPQPVSEEARVPDATQIITIKCLRINVTNESFMDWLERSVLPRLRTFQLVTSAMVLDGQSLQVTDIETVANIADPNTMDTIGTIADSYMKRFLVPMVLVSLQPVKLLQFIPEENFDATPKSLLILPS